MSRSSLSFAAAAPVFVVGSTTACVFRACVDLAWPGAPMKAAIGWGALYESNGQ